MKNAYIARAVKLIISCGPWWAAGCAAMIVVRGLVPLLLLLVMKTMVDECMGQIQTGEVDWGRLGGVMALVAGVYLLNALSASLYQLLRNHHGAIVNERLQEMLMRKCVAMPYSHFEDPKQQDVYHRAVVENQGKPMSVFYTSLSVLQQGFTLLLLCGVLIRLAWYAPLVIAVSALPLTVARLHNQRRMYKLRQSQTADERRLGYRGRLNTQREYAKEVRVFGLGNLFVAGYTALQKQLRRAREKEQRRAVALQLCAQTFTVAGLLFMAYLTVAGAAAGTLSIGEVAMFMLAIQRASQIGQDVMSDIASLADSGLYLRNLFEFLDLPAAANSIPPAEPGDAVTIRNLSFKYPSSERGVFSNLSLSVKKGETVAIKGKNGSGKSTIVKLLCGFFPPDGGQLGVSGKISAIFQDFTLYNASTAENIWYGDITKERAAATLREAAHNAGLDQLIASLPRGYDTQLGVLFDESEMLSQGQWQRVALARMFFADTAIVILDEPTAALDADTKAALKANFRRITRGRTAIIISHDPEILEIADRVIEL